MCVCVCKLLVFWCFEVDVNIFISSLFVHLVFGGEVLVFFFFFAVQHLWEVCVLELVHASWIYCCVSGRLFGEEGAFAFWSGFGEFFRIMFRNKYSTTLFVMREYSTVGSP